MRAAIVGLTAALLAPTVPAQEPAGGAKVYRQAIPSVVWVRSDRDRGWASGTGTVIDRDRRLVLTNYHVVGDNPKATAFFPVLRDGRPVPEPHRPSMGCSIKWRSTTMSPRTSPGQS